MNQTVQVLTRFRVNAVFRWIDFLWDCNPSGAEIENEGAVWFKRRVWFRITCPDDESATVMRDAILKHMRISKKNVVLVPGDVQLERYKPSVAEFRPVAEDDEVWSGVEG